MRFPLPRPHADESLAEYLEREPRAYVRAELLARWSRYQLDQGVAGGRVLRILPGVYCSATHREHPHAIAEAITLWNPHAVVTGELALALAGVPIPTPRVADVVVPAGSNPRTPAWLRTHQTAPLKELSGPYGVRCTVAERSVIEAWRRAAPQDRRNILYAALWERACTWRQVRKVALADTQLPGRRELLTVLAWFAEGVTSPMEVVAKHQTFADREFREFEWQVELQAGGRRWVGDMVHRRAKLIVEFDGEKHHSTPHAWRRDRERDIELAAAGYLTLRLTWSDLTTRPEWCRARVLTVLKARLASELRT